jgi:cytochrome c oxidase cbb3-type subunit IV
VLQTLYEWANALWGLWLMILFLGIVIYVFWPKRRKKLEAQGRIPLEDDEQRK